jgi:hypothetical protein
VRPLAIEVFTRDEEKAKVVLQEILSTLLDLGNLWRFAEQGRARRQCRKNLLQGNLCLLLITSKHLNRQCTHTSRCDVNCLDLLVMYPYNFTAEAT